MEGLALAVSVHVVHGGEDIRLAMRAADQEMYAEKKAYYAGIRIRNSGDPAGIPV